MALNKQQILNELDSVVNQLQSDGGCMGKIFSDSNACNNNSSKPPSCSGCELNYSQGHFMNLCQPAKLYADTYNYVNQHLVQPAIRKIQNDQKLITPTNTTKNNPTASQGFPVQENCTHLNQNYSNSGMVKMMGQNQTDVDGTSNQQIIPTICNNMPKVEMANGNMNRPQQINYNHDYRMGDTCPQTVNMMMNEQNNPNEIPVGGHQGSFEATEMTNIEPPKNPTQSMTAQHIAQQNMFRANCQGDVSKIINPDQTMGHVTNNPIQEHAVMHRRDNCGHCNPGVAKVNDMFPGVVQNASALSPTNTIQSHTNNYMNSSQSYQVQQPATSFRIVPPHVCQQQQPVYMAMAGDPSMNQDVSQQYIQQQQPGLQYPLQQHQCQQQHKIPLDSNEGAFNGNTKESSDPIVQIPQVPSPTYAQPIQQYTQEPIFTSDNLNIHNAAKVQRQCQYNTLGQPVEMLPARLYHTPEPKLPQTLSPQNDPSKLRSDVTSYSNVKSTISKTSLMGNRPLGNIPSRSQLQNIYNQYKGSHLQDVRASERTTHSAGSHKTDQANNNYMVVEKFGGDSATNDQNIIQDEPTMGKMGDIPENIKILENQQKEFNKVIPSNQGKCRNGLQDMVFTAYPSSTTAWSFHGRNPAPLSAGYRFRNSP